MADLQRLRSHSVEVDVQCTVNRANQDYPVEVYRFFRDNLLLRPIQFLTIVERRHGATGSDRLVTDRSVDRRHVSRLPQLGLR